ncbi:RNA ligase RtcB family protein [Pseudoduganella aquatica]|uniref:RNA ligase RtcB family protein n=1 Tax=Pseudoduganella aquatica TaxID=2660641 RepID=UPI001E60351F|nr:RNA ligase RtcB family protein [Pseudoduganella aquatica]
MGKFIRNVSDRASVVASDDLWLEGAALQQLQTTSLLAGMRRVVGLPDLHPARGYPVGASFFSVGRFYPALCGGDIGCGVSLWQTGLLAGKVKLDKLDKQIGNLDVPPDEAELSRLAELQRALDQGGDGGGAHADGLEGALASLERELAAAGLDAGSMHALGTIGLGNHFVELQSVSAVLQPELFDGAGLQAKRLQLMVHSGSRGLGQIVLRRHVDLHGHAGLEDGTPAARDYLRQHDAALSYAHLNRRLIALRMLLRLRSEGAMVLDVDHNLVTPAVIDGEAGWLHRKGANPSDRGMVMLPGSRGDYSYLLQPLPAQDSVSLQSLAHGAGRKWIRGDCKERLQRKATPAQLARTTFGGRVICEDKALIYEEAPQAYKDVGSVLDSMQGAGLVEAVARFQPLLTYKTRGECC